MNGFVKRMASLVLALVLCVGMIPVPGQAAEYVANWGTRGEVTTELSDAAQAFYTGDNTYDVFYTLENTHKQNDVPQSEIYLALQAFMVKNHTTQTSYGDTRYQYMYTDCEKGDTTLLTLFYGDKAVDSQWDGGTTYNREHVWPKSKSLWHKDEGGDTKNSTKGETGDIMVLRPANPTTNFSRGDTAYGESSGYYALPEDVRGDAARTLLYGYVRWGNTKYLFGAGGAIESLTILLKWMEEDPVDTWELGRNDSVQSITGTRNVFVDYPELAFVLFGQEIPSDMVTPSGEAKNQSQTPEPEPTEPGASTTQPTTGTKPADKNEAPEEQKDPPTWLLIVAAVIAVLLIPAIKGKKGKKRRRGR